MPTLERPAEAPETPDGRTGEGGGVVAMRDFVTDGSVAGLCDNLARLVRAPIWLRDQSGEVIVPEWSESEDGDGAGHPWSIINETAGRARAFALVGRGEEECEEPTAIPLRIRAGLLGSIVICMPRDVGDALAETIRRALGLLASSVCDVCEAQWALRQRVKELDALYRLSGMLSLGQGGSAGAPGGEADRMLEAALNLAIEAIGVDAGSIAVIEEGRETPVIRASRGLSRQWASDTETLSRGGVLRQAALRGEIVRVEDLLRDPRIEAQERIRAEGLASLLSTGLRDQGVPIGLIRLYTRRPRLFTQAEGELLRAIAEHAAAAVTTARLRRLREQDEAMKRQVRLAASVQRRMLPRTTPQVAPFDVAAHYAPSFELGGDFYDFLELGGHLGILVGDVAGKGVPAALLMSSVRASLRAHAQDIYHIGDVLKRVNRALVRDTLDNEFVTMWYGVADPVTLRLTYCAAGHDWPLLARVPRDRAITERDCERLTADGMALGIDPSQEYPLGVRQLAARDVLVAWTDGLHDATDFEGRKFGGTRLRRAVVDLLSREPEASAARVVDHVLAEVRQFSGLSGRTDDITIVALRVNER
ncbi:MAG: SpoIIE family protein phosphatase [Phycisphaeraceae bacterium]|nr:SpoIIE family protein phosphatase [Phycisphaeraceae bacterium]